MHKAFERKQQQSAEVNQPNVIPFKLVSFLARLANSFFLNFPK